MTTVAVMQPYLFPYVGYYQMASMVDDFVFLDDARFIVRGFVNRNSILRNEEVHRFTVPVRDASQNRAINDHEYLDRGASLLALLQGAYRNAPHLHAASALVEQIFNEGAGNVAATNALSIRRVLEYAGLDRRWHFSSEVLAHGQFKGVHWISEISRRLSATRYLNLPGGRSLYDPVAFEASGLTLEFVEPVFVPYPQDSSTFVPGLSILDALMWCEPTEIAAMLQAGRSTAMH